MKRPRPTLIVPILIAIIACATAMAAVGTIVYQAQLTPDNDEPESGSGAVLTVEEEQAQKMEERRTRSYGFVLRVRNREQEHEAFLRQEALRLQKRMEHVQECREEVRRANKDLLFRTNMRCYRAQLTLHLESLRKQRQELASLPGLTETVRSQAFVALDALRDAVTAIINGIDTGVYSSVEELREANVNLAERYRIPYWNTLSQARIDQIITWIAHLLTAQDVSHGMQTGALLTDMHNCLAETEAMLIALEIHATESILPALESVQGCIRTLLPQEALSPAGEAAPAAREEEKDTKILLPRRILRNLPEQ